MSAVVGEPAAGGARKYVNFDEYVDFQVNKTRAGIRSTDLLLAGVTVLLVVAAYLLLFVVADQWLIAGGFSDWTRTVLLAAVVAFIGVWTAWKIVLPYWRRVTALYAAKELEGTQPLLKSSLLTLVDLKQAGRDVSPHILTALEKRAALQLSQIDVEQAVDRRPLMRLAYALLGVVVALCLYTVLSPKPVGASLLRALIPIADIGVATRTQILNVDPGAATILARSQLEVTVDVKGEIPPEATLLYTTHDRSLVDEAVVLRDTGEGLNRFRGTLTGPNGRGLLQDFTYRIVAGDARSETFPVRVQQAPYATVESVTYTYPQYMGLDPQTQSGGEIEAWEGTKVTLRGVTNMPVAEATLQFHDTEDTAVKAEGLPLRLVDSTHFELTWTLQFRRDGTFPHFYQVDLRTEAGQRDPVPRLYSQTIRRDLPPDIKLLHPTGDLELPANAVLPLSFTARDPDFMLRSIRLRFEQRDMPLDARTRHLYDAPPYRAEFQGQSEIRLSDFSSTVKPGDVLTFYLEAWDNMAPLDREGNRSVTPKINITIRRDAPEEEVEQIREQEAQAAQQRLDEAQSPQTAEPGDAEPPPEAAAGEDPPTEPPANENQPTEPGDAGQQAGDEPQAGERTAGNEQATNQQNAESSEAQNPEGAQQQQRSGEQTQDASQQQTQDGGDSGQQSKAGDAHSSPVGTGQQQKSGGNQSGSEPGTQQQRTQPRPGEEASDDEALAKLLNKYKDEIRQQREQEQQQDGGSSDESQQGGRSSSNNPQQKSSGDQGSEGSESPTGDSNQSENEETASSEGSRSDGAKSSDTNNSQQQNEAGEHGEQSGDPAESANPEAQQKQPGERPQPGEKSQTPGSQRDPRESQDPRAAEERKSPGGKPQPKSGQSEQQQGTGEQSQPMAGESDSSQSTSPSGQQSRGSGTPSEDPSTEKPASEGGAKPEGAEGRPSNEDANQTGEPEQPGANDPNSSERSKTGGQPKGADEQNPGEGRKRGQRADQPQTGEKGSSQHTSEGQESNESGAGESSDSPGSKSAGEGGQSSPGAGKPAGDKPGQPQSGGGSESQPGEGGSKSPDSGDPQQSDSAGSEGAEGSQQGTGNESKQGEQPSSQGNSDKPQNKVSGERGQPEQSQSSTGEQESGEAGTGGEPPKAGEEKPGTEQSGGDSEQSQGGEKPSESGGNQQGGKPQGEGNEGSGDKGNGSEGGGQEGGAKGSGSQSGSPSGGESSEGSSSNSSEPGNSQQTGQPGSGQQSGGRVGAGGRGTNEGAAPQGSGGADGAAAGPAEPADLSDKKKATELVLQKLQDEISRGELSQDLLQDLGWTEQNLRDFMDRLDRRLSDTGEDQSPEAAARRRQFDEILRGIDYESEGVQRVYDGRDRPVEAGAGPIPRLPAPSEFRRAEESMRQKLSRETKSK